MTAFIYDDGGKETLSRYSSPSSYSYSFGFLPSTFSGLNCYMLESVGINQQWVLRVVVVNFWNQLMVSHSTLYLVL